VARVEVLGGEIPVGKWYTNYFFEDVFPEITINVDGEFRKLDGSSGFSMLALLDLTSFQSFQPCHTAQKCLQRTFAYNIL